MAKSMGYGTVEDTTAINNRNLVIFRKWPYEDLSEDCQKQLKRAKISEEAYSRSLQGVKGTTEHQLEADGTPRGSREE